MPERFHFTSRRNFLRGAIALGMGLGNAAWAQPKKTGTAVAALADLEKHAGGRLGVAALNTANGQRIGHRADERFPLCSTFKIMLAGAMLKQSVKDADVLQQRVRYERSDLVSWSPLTERHVDAGMQVDELCAANQLMKLLGGPAAVTAYARSIGNMSFRLDRWETDLNTALPGDLRDTATPASMADSLHALTLGSVLPTVQRTLLNDWLLGNTTGDRRIRAGVPATWRVGDKTGSGDYGTANDIGVLWPPGRSPIVLAIYHTQREADAHWNDAVIAEAASIVSEVLHA